MDPSYFFNNSLCNPALFCSSTPPPPQPNYSSEWTFEEDKIFEIALAEIDLNSSNLFERIGLRLPRKSIEQIKQHFNTLIEDVDMIESGVIPLPDYKETSVEMGKKSAEENKSCHPQQQRKKGVPWTDKEHELFLRGLDKYGKGDWRSISRNFVVTRTPTQVASHAQKYFLKLQNANSRSKRRSTSEYASMAKAMALASASASIPSPSLSGPSAAASMADQFFNDYPHFYQNQS